ncbi:MAG: heparinase II/III family protein [Candidatus Firestonebacteria bacterium]
MKEVIDNKVRKKIWVIIWYLLIASSSFLYSHPLSTDYQILSGQISVFRSLESFIKGVYNFNGLFGENADVNGDLYYCKWVFFAQYPSKANGYLRYYAKTEIPEYKELSEQIIDKLYQVYKNTKDKDGENWLPTHQLVADDGKFYGYSEKGSGDRRFPYDQSKGKYFIKSAGFPDAFGIGMLELSEVAKYLDSKTKSQLIEILEGMLDFWNRDYMIVWKGGRFYYRSEDVEPSNPVKQVGGISWGCLGQDVIYLVKSLYNLGIDTDKYDTKLRLFLKTYLNERVNHSNDYRIEYLDDRILELTEYFSSKNKFVDESKEINSLLKYLYSKNGLKKAVFMYGGSLTAPSTIPFLEIYRKLDLKDKFKTLWKDIMENYFDEETGIKVPKGTEGINGSAYPVLLDYGYNAWKNGILTDEEFISAFKKYYLFKGNPSSFRNLDDWVIETGEFLDGKEPYWIATPYDGYPEKVESEAYYGMKAEPQGYTIDRFWLGDDPNNRKNRSRNVYYQFVAPFQNHAEKLRYGTALSFHLLDTTENPELKFDDSKGDKIQTKVKFKFQKVPVGSPCLGIVDVTEMYYKDKQIPIKEGYQITKVIYNNVEVPFEVSHMFSYERTTSRKHRARLCFSINYDGNKEKEAEVIAEKIKFPYYFAYKDIEKSNIKSPIDLLFYKVPHQDSTLNWIYKDVLDWIKKYNEGKIKSDLDAKIYNDWMKWVLAYKFDKEKNNINNEEKYLKKYLQTLKDYLEQLKVTTNEKSALRLNELIRMANSIKEVLEKDTGLADLIKKRFIEDAELLLKSPSKTDSLEIIEESKGLIRYGILYPELNGSKESIEKGFKQIIEFLQARINEEGMDKEKETTKITRILIELIRLANLNNIEIPQELISLVEKMVEFLMYVSEPDGTVLKIADKINDENIREIFYWASKMYKRKDFRYVAFGGLLMENSFSPERTNVYLLKSKIFVMRNSWNIRDRRLDMEFEDKELDRELLGERQIMLAIDLNNANIEITPYGRTLAFIEQEPKSIYELSEMLITGRINYIKLSQKEDNMNYIEIVNMKPVSCNYNSEVIPGYFLINVRDSKEKNVIFNLNTLRVCKEESKVKTINKKERCLFSSKDDSYFGYEEGEIWIEPFDKVLQVDDEEKRMITTGKDMSFIIYPYVHDKKKSKEEKVDKNYKPDIGEEKIKVFGTDSVYFKKRIAYSPTLESKKEENKLYVKVKEDELDDAISFDGKIEDLTSDGKIVILRKTRMGQKEIYIIKGKEIKDDFDEQVEDSDYMRVFFIN